jgi:hypothetical protein
MLIITNPRDDLSARNLDASSDRAATGCWMRLAVAQGAGVPLTYLARSLSTGSTASGYPRADLSSQQPGAGTGAGLFFVAPSQPAVLLRLDSCLMMGVCCLSGKQDLPGSSSAVLATVRGRPAE